MKTHFNLVSGVAIIVATSFTVGLFGCSAENSMESFNCFSYKCTDNDYDYGYDDDDYDYDYDDDYYGRRSSSSNKKNSSSSKEMPQACDFYVSSLTESPQCYPENYGETMYAEDIRIIFACEPNMFTKEASWSALPNLTDCDEYIPSYSSSSSVMFIFPSSSSLNMLPEYGTLIDYRDGNVYQTVTIGTQVWMAENLRYRYIQETAEEDSSSFCFNANQGDPGDCDIYGRYYLWSAAMDSAGLLTKDGLGCGNGVTCKPYYPVQGICPDRWHLPSAKEMKELIDYTMSQDKGTDLRSVYGWTISGTNQYGFNAFGSGIWNPSVSGYPQGIYMEGYLTSFWTSTQNYYDEETVPVLILQVDENDLTEYAGVDDEKKWRGFPIRCVQN